VKPGDYRNWAPFWATPTGVWLVGGAKDDDLAADDWLDIWARDNTTGLITNTTSYSTASPIYNWTDVGLVGYVSFCACSFLCLYLGARSLVLKTLRPGFWLEVARCLPTIRCGCISPTARTRFTLRMRRLIISLAR
jgi:hypothetical protein